MLFFGFFKDSNLPFRDYETKLTKVTRFLSQHHVVRGSFISFPPHSPPSKLLPEIHLINLTGCICSFCNLRNNWLCLNNDNNNRLSKEDFIQDLKRDSFQMSRIIIIIIIHCYTVYVQIWTLYIPLTANFVYLNKICVLFLSASLMKIHETELPLCWAPFPPLPRMLFCFCAVIHSHFHFLLA